MYRCASEIFLGFQSAIFYFILFLQVGAENASLKPITELLPKVKKAVKTCFHCHNLL